MKECELCRSPARMYCDSDEASLCWDCDAAVHGANFLVARHTRTLLCRRCQAPTPWRAAGSSLGPAVSVCDRCCREANSAVAWEEDEEEDDDEEVDSYEEEEEGEEEVSNIQVVPRSPQPSSPPVASSSSDDEEEGGFWKWMMHGNASDGHLNLPPLLPPAWRRTMMRRRISPRAIPFSRLDNSCNQRSRSSSPRV